MADWDRWQTVLAVFRSGSYSRAAKSLRLDATTVARRVKQLEKHVGSPLFLRHQGRLHPTSRCETLLAHIEAASEALRLAEHETSTRSSGAVWRELRLNAFPYLCTNLFAPAISEFAKAHRIRIELMGTVNRLNLSRREADIVIRLHQEAPDVKAQAEQIGVIDYAVYCARGCDPESLPWAGVIEGYINSPDGQAMVALAGEQGFQFHAYQYDAVYEITRAGGARAMLPRFVADMDDSLECISDTVFTCPLWMLYHVQDTDIPHLKAAREWIKTVARDRL